MPTEQEMVEALRRRGKDPRAEFEKIWGRGQPARLAFRKPSRVKRVRKPLSQMTDAEKRQEFREHYGYDAPRDPTGGAFDRMTDSQLRAEYKRLYGRDAPPDPTTPARLAFGGQRRPLLDQSRAISREMPFDPMERIGGEEELASRPDVAQGQRRPLLSQSFSYKRPVEREEYATPKAEALPYAYPSDYPSSLKKLEHTYGFEPGALLEIQQRGLQAAMGKRGFVRGPDGGSMQGSARGPEISPEQRQEGTERLYGPGIPLEERRAERDVRFEEGRTRGRADLAQRQEALKLMMMDPLDRAAYGMIKRRKAETKITHERDIEKIEAARPQPTQAKWGERGPADYEEKLKIEDRYRAPAKLTEQDRGRADINFTIAQDIVDRFPNLEDETAAIQEVIGRGREITAGRGSPKAVQEMLKGYYGSIEAPEEPDELSESERGRADVNFAFANRIFKDFPGKEQRAEAIREALTKAPLITQQGGNPTSVLNIVKGFYSGGFVEDLITGIEGIVAEQEKRRQGLR